MVWVYHMQHSTNIQDSTFAFTHIACIFASTFPKRLCKNAVWDMVCCSLRTQTKFFSTIIIGDEAALEMNGKVNTENIRTYAPHGKPPALNFNVNTSRQKLTVWLGFCGNGQLVGHSFFERNVDGNRYLQNLFF